MINAYLNSRSYKTVNQNCFGQFGTTDIPVALSEIIFVIPSLCMKMEENSKRINYDVKHKMHLSLLLSGLIDKQKIDGVGHLF